MRGGHMATICCHAHVFHVLPPCLESSIAVTDPPVGLQPAALLRLPPGSWLVRETGLAHAASPTQSL